MPFIGNRYPNTLLYVVESVAVAGLLAHVYRKHFGLVGRDYAIWNAKKL